MTSYCDNEDWAAAYLDKRLSEKERQLYEIHLSNCPNCLANLIATKKELAEMGEHALEPVDFIDATKTHAIPAAPQQLGPPGFTRRLQTQWPLVRRISSSHLSLAAASILILLFFHLMTSPAWDPNLIAGRSSLRKLLSTSYLGDLRLAGGWDAPMEAPVSIRGRRGTIHSLTLNTTERLLKKAQSTYPYNKEIYTLIGHLYLVDGQPDRAANYYRWGLQFTPDDGVLLNNLAVTAYRKGETGRSLDLLERAIKAENTPPEAFYNQGIIHHEVGNTDEMVRSFNKYLEFDPKSPWAAKARSLLIL